MQKHWVLTMLLAIITVALLAFGCGDESISADGDIDTEGDFEEDANEYPLPANGGNYCEDNGDCQSGQICVNSYCGVACESDDTCAKTERCLSGACKPFCDNVCREKDGFYCDLETQVCKMVDCLACDKDESLYYCGQSASDQNNPGHSCTSVNDDFDNKSDYCLQDCSIHACPEGYDCNLDQKCFPKALCKSAKDAPNGVEIPASVPGGPCAFDPLWPGYKCTKGDSCIGNPATTQACTTQADCFGWGEAVPNLTGEVAYCANGVCGFSFCVSPCNLDGSCPTIEGLDIKLYPDMVGSSCYCGPDPLFAKTGEAPVGSICDPGHESDFPLCKTGTCIAITDSTACAANTECEGLDLGPNSYCSAINKCAYSFCSNFCTDGKCPAGQNYVPGSNQCYCTTDNYGLKIGAATLGDKCDAGAEDSFPGCIKDLHCRKYNEMTDPNETCTTVDDCPEAKWGANRYCSSAGFCEYSVCAKPCNTEGDCSDGTTKLKNTTSALCLCAPAPYGE